MKIEKMRQRLLKNRPMTPVTLRMPKDVVEDLKRVAPMLGFSGYQPLIRAYVGQGLRKDLQRLEIDTLSELVAGLRKRGVNSELIEEAVAEAVRKKAG